MPATANLTLLITAKDEASSILHKLGGSGGLLPGLGLAAVAAGAALAGGLVVGLASSISAAAEFEAKISAVKAVTGATAEEAQQLSKVALQLGKDTSFSASAAAEGIGELAKGGVSVADIMGGAAAAALNLAAAGGVSVADAAAIAANAMALFNIEGSETAHVADMIAGFANATTGSVTDFKFALASAGAVAKLAGQDFDQTAVAIALMGKNGILGSDAGTSLKTMLNNLIPTTKSAIGEMQHLGLVTIDYARVQERLIEILKGSERGQKLLADATKKGATDADSLMSAVKKLGGAYTDLDVMKVARDIDAVSNGFINADGSFKDLRDIAGALNEVTKDLSESERSLALETIFGSDAIRAAAILAEAGAAGFDAMAEAMSKVDAESVAKTRLDNLSGSMEQLGGSVETAKIMLGMEFTPILKEAADETTKWLNESVIPFIEKHGPEWAEAVRGMGAGLKEFKDDPLKGVREELPETTKAFQRLSDAGVGELFSKLGGLTHQLMLVGGDDGSVRKTTASFIPFLLQLELAAGAVNELGDDFSTLGSMANWVRERVQDLGTAIVEGIIKGMGGGAGRLKDGLTGLLGDAFQAGKDWLISRSPSQRAAKELGEPIVEGIMAGIESQAPWLADTLTVTLGDAAAAAVPAAAAAGTAVGNAYAEAMAAAMAVSNGTGEEEAARKVAADNAQKAAPQKTAAPGGGGGSLTNPFAYFSPGYQGGGYYAVGPQGPGYYDYAPPRRAGGGPVQAGMRYTVGEGGSETFVPDRDGTIMPHGGESGGEVHNHIYLTPGGAELVDLVVDLMTGRVKNLAALGQAGG